jgi:hypothetical protein
MLKDLIKMAGRLDALGLRKEADFADRLIRKVAQADPEFMSEHQKKQMANNGFLLEHHLGEDSGWTNEMYDNEHTYLQQALLAGSKGDPRWFINNMIWSKDSYKASLAEPYAHLAAKSLAEKDPTWFLTNLTRDDSKAPWAEPYIDYAANNLAENRPDIFLRNFKNRPWARPFVQMAEKFLKSQSENEENARNERIEGIRKNNLV